MMTMRFIAAAALVLAATTAGAQTQAELLEQAIYLEETVGDVNGAIQAYERLLKADTDLHDIAMQARKRLTALVDQRRQTAAAQTAGGCCGEFSQNYDPGRLVSVTGTISRVQWAHPQTYVVVEGTDGNRWGFTLSSVNTMIRAAGWNRDTPLLGERVFVVGYLAKGDTPENCQLPLPHACHTLQDDALHASASSVTGAAGTIYDRAVVEREDELRLQELRKAADQQRGR